MPQIRVMNWNIESLSRNKIKYPGFLLAVARTIIAADVDVLIIVELRKVGPDLILDGLSRELNGLAPGLHGNDWLGNFYSHDTGTERYGVLIRNLDLIRPVGITDQNVGTAEAPIKNLLDHRFEVLPSDFPNPAYPINMASRQVIPLIDLYATDPLARRVKKKIKFAGSRKPCLIVFKVHTANDYIFPIVGCHYGATRKGTNALAQFQVDQLRLLHIAQLYSNYDLDLDEGPGDAVSRYMNIGGHPVRVQELAFTGDFNMDFMENAAGHPGSTASRNRNSYDTITPTAQFAGSTAPPADAPPAAPGVPSINPVTAPDRDSIPKQALRAAVTAQGTILIKVADKIKNCQRPYWCLRSAAFDNFFYGGTQFHLAVIPGFQPPDGANDAGEVINMPDNVVRGVPHYPEDFNVQPIASYYIAYKKGVKGTGTAFGLYPPWPKTARDVLVGARLLSDHLPVVVEFPCP